MSARTFFLLALLPSSAALRNATFDFRTGVGPKPGRVNMCERRDAVAYGNLELKDVLRGLHLNVVAVIDGSYFDEPINNTDPNLQTGLHVELLRVLSENAGFSFTVYSHPASAFRPENSYTEWALKAGEDFDLIIDWFMLTEERTSFGLVTPYDFLDLSMVATKRTMVASRDAFHFPTWEDIGSFLRPFAGTLWLVFLALTALHALVYAVIEGRRNTNIFSAADPRPDDHSSWLVRRCRRAQLCCYRLGRTEYYAAVQVTGVGGDEPLSGLGKLLLLGYSILILFFVTACEHACADEGPAPGATARVCTRHEPGT